eukprot:2320811-Amphidinium_carterae.1
MLRARIFKLRRVEGLIMNGACRATEVVCVDCVIQSSMQRLTQREREKYLELWGARCAMESRALVLEAVKEPWDALKEVGEVRQSDREVVLTAVQAHGAA